MKKIDTLVKDIRDRLVSGKPFDATVVSEFSKNLANKLAERLSSERDKPSLRLSNLGQPDRKLWYSINKPELAEPLSPSARLKFLFGDILEEVLLFLAKASGHTVTSEQKEVSIAGVKGHIDGIVDGELVDCKSASSFSFRKFQNHGLVEDDPFGYLTQGDSYLTASYSDDSLDNKSRYHFLAVDKQLGHITLDTHGKQLTDYDALVERKRKMLEFPQPPSRCYSDEPDGASGNRKLGVACSYCPFKRTCWPGLRAFSYRSGSGSRPVFLTRVVREPKVPEITLDEAVKDE